MITSPLSVVNTYFLVFVILPETSLSPIRCVYRDLLRSVMMSDAAGRRGQCGMLLETAPWQAKQGSCANTKVRHSPVENQPLDRQLSGKAAKDPCGIGRTTGSFVFP